jgi:hypothetical protein
MQRLMIVAHLRPESAEKAEALIALGPPFDPQTLGFERHGVFLSGTDVVFLFEGANVERRVDAIVNDPALSTALAPWANLIEWPPRIAHERYTWTRQPALRVQLGR